MKGRRKEKYLVIAAWEAFFKMLINVVIVYQKASLKETDCKGAFQPHFYFSALEYFANMELHRELLRSPMTS